MYNIKIPGLIVLFYSVFTIVNLSSLANAACSDPPGPGVDWSGCDKTPICINLTYFTNTDLSGANLSGANFNGCGTFEHVNFTGANLSNANFQADTFMVCTFTDANLTGTILTDATITIPTGLTANQFNSSNRKAKGYHYMDLSGFDLSQVVSPIFENVDLAGANLIGADLSQVLFLPTVKGVTSDVLKNAKSVKGVSFEAMDLSNFDFSGLDMLGAGSFRTFYGCKLTGANFTNSKFEIQSEQTVIADNYRVDFTNANLTNATVMGTITGANFSNANLSGTNFNLFYYNNAGSAYTLAPVYVDVNFLGATGVPQGIGAGLYLGTTCPDGTVLNGYGACWDGIKIIVNDDAHEGRMYAVHENKKGIYYRTSASGSWIICSSNGLADDKLLTLIADKNGKLYAGTKSGIYSSFDGCANWTPMNDGLKN